MSYLICPQPGYFQHLKAHYPVPQLPDLLPLAQFPHPQYQSQSQSLDLPLCQNQPLIPYLLL